MILILLSIMAILIRQSHMLPSTRLSSEMIDNKLPTDEISVVTRGEWNARKAKEVTPLTIPVPYVVIHHSYTPSACNSTVKCCEAMRSMQDFHQDDRGWWDIGYHFGVGGDGKVYEGRGWEILGAHALHFNSISIGICLIGDWSTTMPPIQQLHAAKSLIAIGVARGYIKPDYKLVGHRQVRDTECPGIALFQEIQTWDHYSDFPASYKDLTNVEELPESVKDSLRNKNS